MDSGLSASDIALLGNENGMGGNAFLWIFALLILCGGFGNFGFGGRNTASDITEATTNEVLLGQKFDAVNTRINQVGDGICSSTYALNNAINGVQTNLGTAITNEGRAIQTQLCAINSNIDNKFASLEKSQLEQRIAEQAQQISQLQTAQMICGIPKISTNAWGITPYNTCGCNV